MSYSFASEHPEIAPTEISNIASVKLGGNIEVYAETKFIIETNAELMVTKAVNKSTIYLGEKLIYTITVTNNGPSNATEVVLVDILPKDADLISIAFEHGTYTYHNHRLRFSLESLDCGKSILVTITIKPTNTGIYKNVACVFSRQPDPDLENNKSIVTTVVNPSKLRTRGIDFFS